MELRHGSLIQKFCVLLFSLGVFVSASFLRLGCLNYSFLVLRGRFSLKPVIFLYFGPAMDTVST
jgi:hypothetical protein